MSTEENTSMNEKTSTPQEVSTPIPGESAPTPNPSFETNSELKKLQDGVAAIRFELNKVIVGQKELIEALITGIVADGNCLIEGVPGIAKTLSAKLLAKTMNVDFSRIQFTPDLMPSDILGTSVFNPKNTEFEFKAGPIFSNIVLIDEINRAPAKTQSALFEAMAEKQITIDGKQYTMEQPFIILATQNPIEQEGTYRLPEAQLDRFLFKINIDYPTMEEETQILTAHNSRHGKDEMAEVKTILNAQDIAELQQIAKNVTVESSIINYIAKLVNQTRNHPMLYLGASPRASISILNAAKAKAATNGRDFVIPEDVKSIAALALRHRVVVSPEKEMEGISPDMIVQEMIESTEIPR
ncbi:MoxR family ATPase [Bacteroidia bacterium]|jgi:MoxR-like ATPase|nr:MoxR family ATPase [Bacteroidia bacterium]